MYVKFLTADKSDNYHFLAEKSKKPERWHQDDVRQLCIKTVKTLHATSLRISPKYNSYIISAGM